MIKIKIILTVIVLLFGNAKAEITSQTLCFANEKNRQVELVFRTYLDNEIQQQIGAIIKYNISKKTILLVYIDDNTSDDTLDYEFNWLEIFDAKITGKYSLLKPKNATILGAYVKYKNYKTGKEIFFIPSGKDGNDCVFR